MPNQKPNVKKTLAKPQRQKPASPGFWTSLFEVPAFLQQLPKWAQDLPKHWEKLHHITRNNYELGLRHFRLGNISDAILRFRMVTWLQPAHADAWFYLGCAYLANGKAALSKNALRKALQYRPGFEEATYMLAIAGGKDTPVSALPAKMPVSLVRSHFDAISKDFSRQRVETFKYQGHILLCGAIRNTLAPERTDYTVLELGCADGLCGPLLRPVASQLFGVDISPPMLTEATKLLNEKGEKIYDTLACSELHEYLRAAPLESFDVVAAAGVASFIGDLEECFQLVAGILKPGGVFGLTAEMPGNLALPEGGFRLDTNVGYYRFSADYLHDLAKKHGFRELQFVEAPLYPNVMSWLCVFAR